VSRVVDVHAHVVVPGLGADVSWRDDAQVVAFGGREIRSAVREFVDVRRILEAQDRAGVDLVLLCPWVALLGREPPRQNEALAAMVGERVAALGTVDPDHPEQLLELMRDGRLSGIELPASIDGDYLGHERFHELWAAAEESGALVFVHPTTRGFELPVFEEYYLWNSVANPVETTVTAAHMVFSGVMERFPHLRVLLAHGGGALPALRGRLRHAQSFQPQARSVLERAPDESLRRFLYDTVTHDARVLRELIEYVGAEHVLCGSDYPFDMGVERPAEIVRSLRLPAGDEAAVLGGNALRLLARQGTT
jgi:aminocarboxymuconate-semialdehyde decarboxylase